MLLKQTSDSQPARLRSLNAEWVDFLRHKKLWGDDDPLFPATIGATSCGDPSGCCRYIRFLRS
jgi:hypothetical protein